MTNSTRTIANPTESRISVELTHDGEALASVYNASTAGEHFATLASGERCSVIATACQFSRVTGLALRFEQIGGEQIATLMGETWTTAHDRLHADGECVCFD